MRQIVPFAITVFSLTAAIIAGYLYFWYIPNTIESQVTHSFDRLGFKNLSYASKNHGGGKLVFNDIKLDDDDFSKIDTITVKYSLFAFLSNGQRAQSLTVTNLKLTGELENGEPNISGWDSKKSLVSMLAAIPAETILFDNASVDLLTDDFGGIDFKFDIQVSNTQGRPAQIRGRAHTQQKKLGFDARLEGRLSAQGSIDLKADIQQIQMQTQDYEIRRFNAEFLWKKEPQTAGNISIEGTAGSILWHGMPLGDVNIAYENSADNYNIVAEGQTIGLQTIEFSSQINHVNGITHYETSITPPTLKDLLSYLDTNKVITNKPLFPPYILDIHQPVLTFETKIDPEKQDYAGSLKLISDQPSFEISGIFKYNHVKKLIIGNFEMPDTTTAIEFKSAEDKPANEEDVVVPEASPASSPVTIDISARGAFEIHNWQTDGTALRWAYEILPHNGEITYGQLKLRNLSGKILNSSSTENSGDTSLSYILPIKETIPHKGTIFINLEKESAPFINKIQLEIYGGYIDSNALSFREGNLPQNITLNIKNINLSTLLQDTRIGGLTMVGQMGGVLPLMLTNGKIMVKGGLLQSEGPGIARISPYMSTEFFPGYTKEMQKIRDALENYHYEYFEIRFDGDFSSSTMMTLKARGFNPDMADKSAVDINLQIETPISAFLSTLLKQ